MLEQTPIIIEKLVHLASMDQLRWKPAQDRWSISEILAHLVHVEGESFRDRIELMMKEKIRPSRSSIRMPPTQRGNIPAACRSSI